MTQTEAMIALAVHLLVQARHELQKLQTEKAERNGYK